MSSLPDYPDGLYRKIAGKRVTLFCGHYGSGKSTVAMSFAAMLRASLPAGTPVAVADLDIVNPYFRTKDCEEDLGRLGIELIASEYASTNVDLPAMPESAYRITEDRSLHTVIDVGGDDRGALAMGRYASALLAEGDFDMLAVINRFRPLTAAPADAAEVMREIELACGLPFTGNVNSSNLGSATTPEVIEGSFGYAGEVSRLCGLPVRFTAVMRGLCGSFEEKTPVLPLDFTISHGGIENR